MDHMMPGMDGVECFHHIRGMENSYFKRVPIIALTANAIAGSREMFLSEGFNDFVAKPIDSALMNEVLQRYIPLEKQIFEDDERYEEFAEKKKSGKKSEKKTKSGKSKSTTAKTEKKLKQEKPKKVKKESNADIFATLDGIDKETALMYCGSEEDFLELADMYCQSAEKYSEDLQTAFEEMDMDSYALISHTIKSTSRTLGATKLSELALVQEVAAKDSKKDTIRDNHDEFLEMYGQIVDKFASVTGRDSSKEVSDTEKKDIVAGGKEIDETEWTELKARIEQCLSSYEADSAEECMATVEGRLLYGKPATEVLNKVLERASNFEFDEAIAELNKIGGKA